MRYGCWKQFRDLEHRFHIALPPVADIMPSASSARRLIVASPKSQGNAAKHSAAFAAEMITKVCQSVTIDWTLRESARAKSMVMMKRILIKYGYPPDLQEEALKTVLLQAELLCEDWAAV